MALATLSIDLIAKLGELQAGMDKAGQIAARNAQQIETRYQRMASVASSVGAALGAALSIAGITTFLKSTIDGVDRLNDLSDATGASIENLSALEDIAARTGTSMNTVGDAVVKLNKSLASANPGTEMESAFRALGLSVTELKALDPAEALRRVAVAMAGFADDGNKARLVQELFGKSIKEVAPLLVDLAKAGQLNATVTTEQAAQAEEFNHQLARMAKNSTDSARAITSLLVPALNQVFANFNSGGVAKVLGLDEFSNKLTQAASAYQLFALGLSRLRVTKILEIDPADPAALLELKQIDERAAALASNFNEARAAYLRLGESAAGAGRGFMNPELARPSLPADLLDPKGPKAKKPERPFALEIDDTTKAALKLIQETDVAKLGELRLQMQALMEIKPEGGGGSWAAAMASLSESMEKLTPEGRAAAAEMARLKSILEQTPTFQLDAVLKDIALINKEFENGVKSTEQWADAIRVVTARLPGEVKPQLEEISDFAKQAARNIQDALGDTVLSVLEGKFDNIGQMWGNLLRKMAAQAIAANIGNYLFGTGKGDDTGVIGAFFGSAFGGARATGGPVQAGRPYLVGERGPELMVPGASGTVVPNHALGGGGTALTVINNVGAGVSRSDLVSALQASARATESRIMQMLAVRRVI